MLALVEKVGDVTVVVVNVVDLDANVADGLREELAPVLKDCRKLVLACSVSSSWTAGAVAPLSRA
jgi:hypothetical protein